MSDGAAREQGGPADGASAARRRRLILGGVGVLTTAALAVPACTGAAVDAASGPSKDAELLTNLLGLEYAAVEAYQAVLTGSFLGEAERRLAVDFQGDHRQHADALVRALGRLGGTAAPGTAPGGRRLAAPSPTAPSLAGHDDALRFLVATEQGLALAQLAAVPAFAGRDLAKGAAGILSVESMHWAAWRGALGETPVPSAIIG